ncbi:uncharacterized protein E0L32_011798 [Thyridium curvatum]|uniref:Thioesterase domain-containing protein n=1 Tax=Thyridium curvatum TaxID=1093900 RepID=A0A507BNG9_9PEZI|nr:uncharacterized protein E0L32_011798 [Thyridium curvatum]TPX18300.1 hypothetical protein E0L32_011798 [Thyridium curvatum]
MFDSNPNLVQDPMPGTAASRATPLVLFHDGGGTVFSYYLLEDLGRPVYGIANPRFYSGEPWEGGLPEMARHYIGYIREAVPPGPVLVGGWSLGGLLALEVAGQLERDRDYAVAGILMVDSICPLKWQHIDVPIVSRKLEWSPSTKEETRVAVTRCFEQAGRMALAYRPPAFREAPPPAILLRALEPVPVPASEDGGGGGGLGMLRVDVHRTDPRLGWDEYRKDLFYRIDDIRGHHFSIFTFENLGDVHEKMVDACRTLEELSDL